MTDEGNYNKTANGSGSSLSNPLVAKLNKVLEKRIENDEELIDGLKTLSEFFVENNIRTRRNLRSQLEKHTVENHQTFLTEFILVKQELDNISKLINGMHSKCQEMSSRLNNAKSQTQDLIQQTTQLQSESQKLEMKAKIADAFLLHFQLTPEESALLKASYDSPLNEDFFKAITRVKEINERCRLLLRSHNQTAGLEIMESMSIYIESAYERLYRWAQSECRQQSHESAEISSILCQAIEYLQDRPVLFKYTMDEYAAARRSAVVQYFIEALSKGGGASLKAIELHSHDPLRYVGDMLAWLHQACASEKESLNTLLKRCNKIAFADVANDCLDQITEGVGRPFKMRTEQVLISEQDSIILYKINNLLQFYRGTLTHLIGEESNLGLTLNESQQLSWRLFFNSLKSRARLLLERPEHPPQDLSPPQAMHGTLNLLKDILTAQDVSMVSTDVRRSEFQQVLSAVVDPLLQYCSISASHLDAVSTAIFITNCLYTTQTALARLEFTDLTLEQVQAHLDANLDTLVSEQAGYILQRCNLSLLYTRVQEQLSRQPNSPITPLSSTPGLDATSVRNSMSQFDTYLASPDSLLLPQCEMLLSVKLRTLIRKRAADLIHTAYTNIHRALLDSENLYGDVNILAPRTPEQVAKLILNF